ncbi:unnamed protein product [Symbiodinium pilosum]|uniref:Uncharacterized protein n=1 Tax=Symbiodinium pilosum TaxID=2952 RepID=A0A812X765_SYMPI|nr:unnamed protein product [Symbiodinium pilosum]
MQQDGTNGQEVHHTEDSGTPSASRRGLAPPRQDRNRSLTESSGFSVPDSEFGVSDRQLNEASKSSSSSKPGLGCVAYKLSAEKLSAGPSTEWQDAEFGLADEQIKALQAKMNGSSQHEVQNDVKPPARRNSEHRHELPGVIDLPMVREVSTEQQSTGDSFRGGLLRDSSRTSSLLRFDSEGLSVAARGAGSAPFESRARGLACLGRARQCFNAFFGQHEGGYHRSP